MSIQKTFVSIFAALALFSSSSSFANDDANSAFENFFPQKYSREELKYARRMFKSVVDNFNATYGLNLTPKEMCSLLKENIDQVQMSSYMKELLLDYINFIETDPKKSSEQ